MNDWAVKFWGLLAGFILSITALAILSNRDNYGWSVASIFIIIAVIYLILWTEHCSHDQFSSGRGRK